MGNDDSDLKAEHPPTRIDTLVSEGKVTVAVTGDIDSFSDSSFDSALDAAADQDLPMVVDLSGCTYIDSAGLSALVRLAKKTRQARTVVVPAESPIYRIFQITGLLEALSIV